MARVGIALGSNLGDKTSSLAAARDALSQLSIEGSEILQAPIYRTAPVDCPADSPDFYNTVIEMSFEGSPQQLIQQTQPLEKQLGRTDKTVHNEARIIDLDLLYFDDVSLRTELLELPHPRLTQRRFVLQPLADIRPDLILPHQTQSVAQLLTLLDTDEPALELVQATW